MARDANIKNETSHSRWSADALVGPEFSSTQGIDGKGIEATFVIQREFDLNASLHLSPEFVLSTIAEMGDAIKKSAFYKYRDEKSLSFGFGASLSYDIVPKYFRVSGSMDMGAGFQYSSFECVNCEGKILDSTNTSRSTYGLDSRAGILSPDLVQAGPLHIGLGIYWQMNYFIPTQQTKDKFFPTYNNAALLGIHIGG